MYKNPTKARLKGNQAIEAYIPSWAKKGVTACGVKGEEDNSQVDEKSKGLLCHADKSLR